MHTHTHKDICHNTQDTVLHDFSTDHEILNLFFGDLFVQEILSDKPAPVRQYVAVAMKDF